MPGTCAPSLSVTVMFPFSVENGESIGSLEISDERVTVNGKTMRNQWLVEVTVVSYVGGGALPSPVLASVGDCESTPGLPISGMTGSLSSPCRPAELPPPPPPQPEE